MGFGYYRLVLGRSLLRWYKPTQVLIDFIGDDHAIVDGAQPARHDDANGSGMEETMDVRWQVHGNFEPFKFGAEGGAFPMAGVTVEGARRGHFDPTDLCGNVGDKAFQRLQRGLL